MYDLQSCWRVERFLQRVMVVSGGNRSPLPFFDPGRCSLLARKIVSGINLCGREYDESFRCFVLQDVVEEVISHGLGSAGSLQLQFESGSGDDDRSLVASVMRASFDSDR